jgi:flavin-dependent dehydrogenase
MRTPVHSIAREARLSEPLACDVLVIGGGPAGSTAAALLAAQGRSVVLLEKDRHPRFHIGESLLPLNLAIFERLGIRAAVDAIGVFKPGAEFVSDATGRAVTFRFADALGARYTYSYQVERAVFDKLLFDTAAERGARAEQGVRVVAAELAPGGRSRVVGERAEGGLVEYAPRFVLDASGRDTFLAGRMKLLESDKRNNTAAVFAHFRDVECRTGDRAGCISVHLAEDGWFWMIPLPGDVVSVGFVGTQRAFRGRGSASLHDFLFTRIDASPSVRDRMRGARLCSEVRSAGNYSYRARQGWGEGYMLIGDAFGFVDPVFSSGVLLAMRAAEHGAAVADAWLDDPARGRTLARRAERSMRAAMDRFGWLIYRINQPAMRGLFMAPRNHFRMRDAVLSVLAGNVRESRLPDLPLTAFKTVYYASACGLRLARLVRG